MRQIDRNKFMNGRNLLAFVVSGMQPLAIIPWPLALSLCSFVPSVVKNGVAVAVEPVPYLCIRGFPVACFARDIRG